jgi:hypothetical protein
MIYLLVMRNDDEMERWRLGEVERELLEIAARARVSTADHAAELMAEIKRIERVVRKTTELTAASASTGFHLELPDVTTDAAGL